MHKMCAGTGIVRLNVLLASWKYRDLHRLELNFALNLVYQTNWFVTCINRHKDFETETEQQA